LCGREHDRPQLMRMSLGGRHHLRMPAGTPKARSCMRAYLWTGLLIGFSWAPAAVHAQSPAGGPRIEVWAIPWSPSARASAPANRPQAALSRGERGALAGALALGTTAAVIRASMCERGESCTGPTIGWGLMGATVGAVLGSLIAARDE
jgi:hypothetical protein